MRWIDVLVCVYLICAMVFFYKAGELSGELESEMELISVKLRESKLQIELKRQAVLIERMKRAGRRRREEIKRLKKTLNGNAITMRMDADGNLWWN